MTDDSPILFIGTSQGIAITLNLVTGYFHAAVQSGPLQSERLLVLRRCIRQALLLERELLKAQMELSQEARHA